MSQISQFPPQVQHPDNQHIQPGYGTFSKSHLPRLLLIVAVVGSLLGCAIGAITFFVPLLLIAGVVLVVSVLLWLIMPSGIPRR